MHQVNIVISGFFGLVYNFPCAIRFYCHWSVFLWSIIVSSPCNSVFQYAIQSLVDFHIQLLFSRFLIAIWYLSHYTYIMHCAKPRHSAIRKSIESKALPIYIYQVMPWSLAEPIAEQSLDGKKTQNFFP